MRDLGKYQKNYEDMPFEYHQEIYRKKKIVACLEKYIAKNILEIGCGRDPIFNHYAACEHCVVIEPIDKFYTNAKRLSKDRTHVTIIKGTLEEKLYQLKNYKYDFIILSSLLHELPNAKDFLKCVRELCTTNTIVHINTPNAKSFHRLLALEMGLIEDIFEESDTQKTMQQSHTFDLQSLNSLIVESGFESLDSGTSFIKPFTHKQMSILQDCGVVTERTLAGLYKMSRYFPDSGSEIFMHIKKKVDYE